MAWAVRRPLVALVVWLLVVVGAGALAGYLHASYNDSFALPGQQSTTAQQLLERMSGNAVTDATARVVWSPATGSATSAATLAQITPALDEIAALPFVRCVAGPGGVRAGADCPPAPPADLEAAVNAEIVRLVSQKTGLSAAEIGEAVTLLGDLAPLADASPAKLAAAARVLPEIAQLARLPRPLLSALAALTPAQLSVLVGLTSADVVAGLEAVGGLDRFVDLPPAVLAQIASTDPSALAAFARGLPKDVGALETFMAELKAAIAKDPSLGKQIEALAAKLGITVAQLRAAVTVIDDLAPIQDADPATLAKVAAVLPTLAQYAGQERPVLDALAKLTPSDLSFLVGLTQADIDDIVTVFGGLEQFSALPASTLKALADADPDQLAALAGALPGQVAELESYLAAAEKEIASLDAAARATQAATSPVSTDGRIAYATITFAEATVDGGQADQVVAAVTKARADGLQVGATGAPIDAAGTGGPDTSVGFGLLVAFVVLLLAFGSLVAAGLPLVVALTGLIGGLSMVLVVARFMEVASFAPTLAGMIGLGVGLDYALFVLSRFDQESAAGADPKDAARTAVGTAGRAVLFAGCTVIVALLGMFVLRITFFNGLAVAAAVTVAMVMASALVMMPALLSLLGRRSLGLRLPWRRGERRTSDPDASRWARYGGLLQKAPAVPVVVVLLLLGVLAWPALGLRQGFADDSSAAQGSVARVGYDLMAEGFGPGVNGPFFVAVQTPQDKDMAALTAAVKALEATPGVASTLPSSAMMPLVSLVPSTFSGNVAAVVVQPATGPQDPATAALLERIRTTTAAQIDSADSTFISVGGATAVNEDFTSVLEAALPLFLLLVVGLGFVALMVLFRSLLVPLTAAVTALLSFAAALGITVAVFQDGVAASLLGVTGTGPILPFLPIMVFAILFGLSMDYQVFLVSRMREEWDVSHDNRHAVRRGLAGSGRVVVVAATIMTSVFLSFVPTPLDAIKMFGVALGAAVLVDAFLVRLVLVPSLMTLLGRANWWLPSWLDRVLPHIALEPPSTPPVPADPQDEVAQPSDPGGSLVSATAPPTSSTR